MGEGSRKSERMQAVRPTALGELIHAHLRGAIETAVVEETALLDNGAAFTALRG